MQYFRQHHTLIAILVILISLSACQQNSPPISEEPDPVVISKLSVDDDIFDQILHSGWTIGATSGATIEIVQNDSFAHGNKALKITITGDGFAYLRPDEAIRFYKDSSRFTARLGTDAGGNSCDERIASFPDSATVEFWGANNVLAAVNLIDSVNPNNGCGISGYWPSANIVTSNFFNKADWVTGLYFKADAGTTFYIDMVQTQKITTTPCTGIGGNDPEICGQDDVPPTDGEPITVPTAEHCIFSDTSCNGYHPAQDDVGISAAIVQGKMNDEVHMQLDHRSTGSKIYQLIDPINPTNLKSLQVTIDSETASGQEYEVSLTNQAEQVTSYHSFDLVAGLHTYTFDLASDLDWSEGEIVTGAAFRSSGDIFIRMNQLKFITNAVVSPPSEPEPDPETEGFVFFDDDHQCDLGGYKYKQTIEPSGGLNNSPYVEVEYEQQYGVFDYNCDPFYADRNSDLTFVAYGDNTTNNYLVVSVFTKNYKKINEVETIRLQEGPNFISLNLDDELDYFGQEIWGLRFNNPAGATIGFDDIRITGNGESAAQVSKNFINHTDGVAEDLTVFGHNHHGQETTDSSCMSGVQHVVFDFSYDWQYYMLQAEAFDASAMENVVIQFHPGFTGHNEVIVQLVDAAGNDYPTSHKLTNLQQRVYTEAISLRNQLGFDGRSLGGLKIITTQKGAACIGWLEITNQGIEIIPNIDVTPEAGASLSDYTILTPQTTVAVFADQYLDSSYVTPLNVCTKETCIVVGRYSDLQGGYLKTEIPVYTYDEASRSYVSFNSGNTIVEWASDISDNQPRPFVDGVAWIPTRFPIETNVSEVNTVHFDTSQIKVIIPTDSNVSNGSAMMSMSASNQEYGPYRYEYEVAVCLEDFGEFKVSTICSSHHQSPPEVDAKVQSTIAAISCQVIEGWDGSHGLVVGAQIILGFLPLVVDAADVTSELASITVFRGQDNCGKFEPLVLAGGVAFGSADVFGVGLALTPIFQGLKPAIRNGDVVLKDNLENVVLKPLMSTTIFADIASGQYDSLVDAANVLKFWQKNNTDSMAVMGGLLKKSETVVSAAARQFAKDNVDKVINSSIALNTSMNRAGAEDVLARMQQNALNAGHSLLDEVGDVSEAFNKMLEKTSFRNHFGKQDCSFLPCVPIFIEKQSATLSGVPLHSTSYRNNLIRRTGLEPVDELGNVTHQAHHIFPQELFGNLFKDLLDFNDPKYLTWWKSVAGVTGNHASYASKYNDEWLTYLSKNETSLRDMTPSARIQVLENKAAEFMCQVASEIAAQGVDKTFHFDLNDGC